MCSLNDWSECKQFVLRNNLLQKTKTSTAKRQYAEIERRLKNLTSEELFLLCNGDSSEVKSLIWLSIVKTYFFIADLINEVLFQNYIERRYNFTEVDYNQFWECKSAIHSNMLLLSNATVMKIRQVIFKMMYDLDIINKSEKRVQKPIIIKQVEDAIIQDSPELLRLFFYEDFEIKMIIPK